MSAARYPADLEVTPEHFSNSGWKEAIDGAKYEGYWNAKILGVAAASDGATPPDEPTE